MVLWELYGPEEQDYVFLNREWPGSRVKRVEEGDEVKLNLALREQGAYRLRAATCDTAGRTAVVYSRIQVR